MFYFAKKSLFFFYSKDVLQLMHTLHLVVTSYLKNVERMKGIVIAMMIVKLVLHVEMIIVQLTVTSLLKLIAVIKYQVLIFSILHNK